MHMLARATKPNKKFDRRIQIHRSSRFGVLVTLDMQDKILIGIKQFEGNPVFVLFTMMLYRGTHSFVTAQNHLKYIAAQKARSSAYNITVTGIDAAKRSTQQGLLIKASNRKKK